MYEYTRAKDYSSTQRRGIVWHPLKFSTGYVGTPSKHCAVKGTTHNQHHWVADSGLVWMCSGRVKKKYANTVV